jgi:dipeptidyl aminopeptidase/acylaminoacyl peptidase
VTTIDQSRGENSHRWPHFLPDGRRFLYFVRSPHPQVRGVHVSALDRPTEKTRLLGSTAAWYAPGRDTPGGYLLWVRDDDLVAQPFDASTAQLAGDAVPIATGPFAAANFREFFSTSTDGTLLYEKAAGRKVQLTWYGRDGKMPSVVGQPDTFIGDPRISPDGKQIAVINVPGGRGQVSIIEIDRGVVAPFAGGDSGMNAMAWGPDSQGIAYSMGAPPNLFVKSTDGIERRLTTTRTTQTVLDWSRDGRYLLYTALSNELSPTTRYDLLALPLTGGEPLQLTRGTFRESDGRFSPDGQWITYTSDESGRNEIYLQRFPDGRTKQRVSTRGGSHARWRGDGTEIFYRSLDGTLMSVPVRRSDSALELRSPVPLFKLPPLLASASGAAGYDATADGQHFLALVSVETGEASPMIVVTNWQADLAVTRPR